VFALNFTVFGEIVNKKLKVYALLGSNLFLTQLQHNYLGVWIEDFRLLRTVIYKPLEFVSGIGDRSVFKDFQ
jgi:hypothetical protein